MPSSGGIRVPDLHFAAGSGDVRVVKKRLEEGDDVNLVAGGMSPLLFSVAGNHNNIVRILLRAGADTSVRDNCGRSAAYWASEHGFADCLKSLIEAKADLNLQADGLITPLLIAVRQRHTKIVRLLLDASVDVALGEENGCTALYIAVQLHQYDTVNILLDAGADANQLSRVGQGCVHLAAESGDKVMLKLLLARGAKADIPDAFGMAPLVSASMFAHAECVSMLLRSGADVSRKIFGEATTAIRHSTNAQ